MHSGVQIELDYFFIDSWDNEFAQIYVDGALVWRQRRYFRDASDGELCGRSGQYHELVEHVLIQVPDHTAKTLTLTVTSTLNDVSTDECVWAYPCFEGWWGFATVVLTSSLSCFITPHPHSAAPGSQPQVVWLQQCSHRPHRASLAQHRPFRLWLHGAVGGLGRWPDVVRRSRHDPWWHHSGRRHHSDTKCVVVMGCRVCVLSSAPLLSCLACFHRPRG